MSAIDEVGLIAGRELRRNLRSAKGIAMFALFVLGGLVAGLVQTVFTRMAMSKLTERTRELGIDTLSPEALRDMKVQFLKGLYDDDAMAKYLADCPTLLHALFWATLFVLPFLVLMVGFDAVAGETQPRTMRYLAGRAHRASLGVGKALGLWGIVAVMTAVLELVAMGKVLVDGGDSVSMTALWGAKLWAFSVVYGGAYAGLTTLVSTAARTPAIALFLGVSTLFVFWLAHLIFSVIPSVEALTWAFPSRYKDWLLSPSPARVGAALGFLVAWGAVFVAAASELLRQKDL